MGWVDGSDACWWGWVHFRSSSELDAPISSARTRLKSNDGSISKQIFKNRVRIFSSIVRIPSMCLSLKFENLCFMKISLVFRNPSLDGKETANFPTKALESFSPTYKKLFRFKHLNSRFFSKVFTGLFTKLTIQFITHSMPRVKKIWGLINMVADQQQRHVHSGMTSYHDWEIGVSQKFCFCNVNFLICKIAP